MTRRAQLPPKDRAARSRLVKLLAASQPLARASLVTMARACGKKNCKCARGDKHVSLYLAARVGRARKMLYVPPELEDQARRLVKNSQTVEGLLDEMSQAELERFLALKRKPQGRPRS